MSRPLANLVASIGKRGSPVNGGTLVNWEFRAPPNHALMEIFLRPKLVQHKRERVEPNSKVSIIVACRSTNHALLDNLSFEDLKSLSCCEIFLNQWYFIYFITRQGLAFLGMFFNTREHK